MNPTSMRKRPERFIDALRKDTQDMSVTEDAEDGKMKTYELWHSLPAPVIKK